MNRPTTDLKPHPLNKSIYLPLEGKELDDFVYSIRTKGIIEPLIVKPDGTILSGHRRWQAAQVIGLLEVPIVESSPENEEVYLVEANRYRQKKLSELMAEAKIIEASIAAETKKNMGVAGSGGFESKEEWKGQTREKVASLIGIGSGRQYDKIKTIMEAAEINPNIAEKVAKIDRGESSIDSVYKTVIGKLGEDGPIFEPKVYNVWNCGSNDPRFGIPYPGRIPGQIIQNTLHYFTEKGALVVDPFSGGGTTYDVCQSMDRNCLAYDLAPSRPDVIQQHDISHGFPGEAQNCDLIFLDPPYWNMVAEDYVEESSSSMTFEDFQQFFATLLHNAAETVKVGGYVACIIMPQLDRLPEGIYFIDWPFLATKFMEDAGLVIAQRIGVNWPTTQYQAYHIVMAREKRRLLGIMGDLVVGRRVE